MAEMNIPDTPRRKREIARPKKYALRIDMTPMVDLGFILITFFVISVQLTKPASVKLYMPKEAGTPTTLGESDALTVLLDNDRIYYYEGDWNKASAQNKIYSTSYDVKDGLGQVIREKQKWLDMYNKKEGRSGLMLLVKPSSGASYQNVIDALDEAVINGVKKYTILKIDAEEKIWLGKQ